jgi:hypothetical protein
MHRTTTEEESGADQKKKNKTKVARFSFIVPGSLRGEWSFSLRE